MNPKNMEEFIFENAGQISMLTGTIKARLTLIKLLHKTARATIEAVRPIGIEDTRQLGAYELGKLHGWNECVDESKRRAKSWMGEK